MGNVAEGHRTMAKAFAARDANPLDIHGIARFQQISGNNDYAKEIFALNAKRFPNQWPVNLGMARSYAMSGDNKQAAIYARKALPQAPDEMNRKNIEGLIKQWETVAAAK